MRKSKIKSKTRPHPWALLFHRAADVLKVPTALLKKLNAMNTVVIIPVQRPSKRRSVVKRKPERGRRLLASPAATAINKRTKGTKRK